MHTWKKIPGCAVRCQPEAGTMECEHSFVFHEPTVFKSHVCAWWRPFGPIGWFLDGSPQCAVPAESVRLICGGISTQPFEFLTQYQLITSVEAKAGEISVTRVKSVLANYDQGGVVAQLVKSKRQGVMFWFTGYLKTYICVCWYLKTYTLFILWWWRVRRKIYGPLVMQINIFDDPMGFQHVSHSTWTRINLCRFNHLRSNHIYYPKDGSSSFSTDWAIGLEAFAI